MSHRGHVNSKKSSYKINMFVLLATSAWVMSKLWGGGVPTSDIDPFTPRIRRYRYTFKPELPPYLFLPFSGSLFSLLLPTAPPSVAVHCGIPLYVFTRSPPPLPEQSAAHMEVTHTRHPPPSAARPCTTRRVPASPAVTVTVYPPLFRPQPFPSSLSDPGRFSHHGSLRLPCSLASPSLISLPNIGIVRSLVSFLGDFFSQRQDARATPLPGSHPNWPSPPVSYLAIPAPFSIPPFPPLPPLPVVFILYPLVEIVGRSARIC